MNIVNNIAVNLNGKQIDQNDGASYAYNIWNGAFVPFLGTNDLLADPLFVNPGAGDFTPGSGSPALGSGRANLAPTLDYAGNARSATAVDRGAIQVTQ